MLRPYLKVWDWDLIFGRGVKEFPHRVSVVCGIDRVIAVGKQYKRNIKTVMENDHQSVRHVVFITSF